LIFLVLATFAQTLHVLHQLRTVASSSSDDNNYHEYDDEGKDCGNKNYRDHQRIRIGYCDTYRSPATDT